MQFTWKITTCCLCWEQGKKHHHEVQRKTKIHLKNAAFKSLNWMCPNRTFGYPRLWDNSIFPSLLAMIKVWIKQEDRKFKVSLNSIHKRGWAYQFRLKKWLKKVLGPNLMRDSQKGWALFYYIFIFFSNFLCCTEFSGNQHHSELQSASPRAAPGSSNKTHFMKFWQKLVS